MTSPNDFTPPPSGPGADYSSAGYGSAPATGYGAYPVATTPYPGAYQNGPSGKTRSPIGVFLLSIITLGIYGIVWYYKVNVELRNFNSSIRVNPTNMILLYIFVPYFSYFSIYCTGQRIQQAQAAAGLPTNTSPGIGVLLTFLIGGHTFYYQDALNSIWQYRQA
ncbi:DUF4234 domain-containing protein [Sanguibacter gelidistatuariae]|uniref:DUF4234 domain-containing protein n=1 Tax=Sanguibacter gelidistatuariae TaxID=1814289 RepID=UPI001587FD3C|nr:DUF4234 domain-containing protein [Sanguibacter gelidistatuariae]